MPEVKKIIVTLCALAVLPAVASAVIISPGYDLFRTTVGPTHQDFSSTPVSPHFFDPGSDPFFSPQDVFVVLNAPDLNVPCYESWSGGDYVLVREAAANIPNIGDVSQIPIELIELSLVSVNPIVVTYNGGEDPEQWRVEVTLSPTYPSRGEMTISKTYANGGSFTAQIQVRPMFVFTRLSDGAVRNLDGMIINDFVCPPTPWVHDPHPFSCPSCGTTNFFPGIDPAGNVVPFILQADNAAHGLEAVCTATVGTERTTWGAIKALYR